jgi:hypothetical protein
VSISWNDDAVIVILRASEMQDKEISIAYNKAKQVPKGDAS